MLEARALLKESTRVVLQEDVEAAQRLRVKAANRRTGAVSFYAPAATSAVLPPTPTPVERGNACRPVQGACPFRP